MADVLLSREVARLATRRAYEDLVRNARAVPEDRHHWLPGGHARTVVQIVAHCGAGSLFLAAVVSGGPLPFRTREEELATICACETLEEAISLLDRGIESVLEAIEGVDAGRLSEVITMPWGEKMPLALGLLIPAQHLLRHDGQVCMIQLLLGDEDFH